MDIQKIVVTLFLIFAGFAYSAQARDESGTGEWGGKWAVIVCIILIILVWS